MRYRIFILCFTLSGSLFAQNSDSIIVNIEDRNFKCGIEGDTNSIYTLKCHKENKLVAIGTWFKGKKYGIENIYFDNGILMGSAYYVNGIAQGNYVSYNYNGIIESTGKFSSDVTKDTTVKEEICFETIDDVRAYQCYYFTYKGLKTGAWRYYFSNGNLQIEANYKAGKREGVWKYYDVKGVKIKTETYENGKLIKEEEN